MNMPITKRTVLSLAVAASLACVGGFAEASYTKNSDDSWTYTYVEGESLPTYIFTNTDPSTGNPSPANGVTIEITADQNTESSIITGVNITGISNSSYEINDDIDITLSNFTSSSFNGVYARDSSNSSVIINGDVTITASNMELTSGSSNPFDAVVNNSENSYLEVGNITMILTDITTDGSGINIDGLHNGHYTSIYGQSSKAENISITISDSSLASSRVAGVFAWDTVEVEDVTISISNTTASSTVYGVAGDGFYTAGAYFKAGDIEVNITNGSSMSGSIYGVSGRTFNVADAYFSAGEVAINISGSTVSGSFYGAYGSTFSAADTSFSVSDIGIDISSSEVKGSFYGAYATSINSAATGTKITVGDVTITADKGSALNSTIDGVHMNTVAADNVTFKAGDVVIDISDSSLSGNICGARIYGISGNDVQFNVDSITINMDGDSTGSDIIGFRLGDNVKGAVTSTIGNIYIDVEGGTESGNFWGFHENTDSASTGDTGGNSSTTIDSIYLKVASLESSAKQIHGVNKLNLGSLTVKGDVTVISESASDSSVRGVYSTAGDVTIGGDVSVTTTKTTDSNVQGVYIADGNFDLTGNITLTLNDLNMPADETADNIEGFRFGGTGEATLGGDITITAVADKDISGYGFDHNIFGAAVTYDSTGKVTQAGNITITIGGENKYLNLTGTIYGLVDATGNNSYTLNGTTKLVFGGDTAFVSDDGDSALAGTFANFQEVVISSGSSLFIDPKFQEALSGDSDIFGTNDPVNYVTDIYSENGTLTLSAENNKLTIESGGQAYIDELVVAKESGTVADDGDLTVTRGSNSGTISGNGELVIGTPTDTSDTFISTGTIDIPTFTLGEAATLDEQDGTVTVKTKADLTAAGFMAVASPATAELNISGDINAQVSVLGKMAIGTPDSFAWTNEALDAAGLGTSLTNVLALKSLVTTGSTGYITVGDSISVLSASDTPGLNFGSDSVLVVDANLLTKDDLSSSAFTTSADSATIAVAEGGTVVLYGGVSKGRYNITSGYDHGGDVAGWYKPTEDDSDEYVKVVDTSGITWNYYRGADEQDGKKYVFIELTSHDPVIDEYPDINVPNIADDDLNDCKDGDYVCGILRDPDLSNDDKTRIINSSSTLLFDGGVTAVSRDGAGMAMDHLYNHLTMDSDTFDKDAKLWQYEESENIWIDTMGGWSKAKSLFKATGLSSYGYRNHSFGIITGWDHKFEDRPFVLGVAVSFEKGSLKSRGSAVSPTKNEYKSYGVHIFGNYSENEHLNLIGSLHWLHNNSGVKQSTGVADFATVSASMHTNTYAAGLRAETMIKAGDVNIIPHVEARYMYGKTRGFDTRVGGSKIWRTKANGTHSLQLPFGVAFRSDKKFDNGWNLRPNLDIEAIPQIGNTKQKTVVTNYNGVSDVIVGQFAGKWAGQARVGFQADKQNATVGAHYTFLGGNKGRAGHTFMLQARTRF